MVVAKARRKPTQQPPSGHAAKETQTPIARALTSAADLTLDPANANRGTARGAALLDESIEACGLGRSILVDRNGIVIGGTKTLAAARARGVEIDVVQADGHDLVVVRRSDLDLMTDRRARQLAYYDNRVRELDLSWSGEQVQADLLAGVDVAVRSFRRNSIS